jgi:hypothetical protein
MAPGEVPRVFVNQRREFAKSGAVSCAPIGQKLSHLFRSNRRWPMHFSILSLQKKFPQRKKLPRKYFEIWMNICPPICCSLS